MGTAAVPDYDRLLILKMARITVMLSNPSLHQCTSMSTHSTFAIPRMQLTGVPLWLSEYGTG